MTSPFYFVTNCITDLQILPLAAKFSHFPTSCPLIGTHRQAFYNAQQVAGAGGMRLGNLQSGVEANPSHSV